MAKRTKLTRAQRRAKYADARHRLSILKSKGLISKRANLKKDKPSSSLLKKELALRPIFTGYAQPVKLSPKARREYKEAGKPIYGKFVVFDKQPNEKIKVSKSGEVKLSSPYNIKGFEQIILPVNVRNFPAFYQWISEHPDELNRMAGPFGYFAFTFYGHPSRETGDAEWLREYLQHYKALFVNEGVRADEANQAFQHLTLFRLNSEEGAYAFGANQTKPGARKRAGRSLDRREMKSRGGPRNVDAKGHNAAQKKYYNSINDRAFRLAEAERVKEYRRRKNAEKRKT